jgi:hypothetical protein
MVVMGGVTRGEVVLRIGGAFDLSLHETFRAELATSETVNHRQKEYARRFLSTTLRFFLGWFINHDQAT